MRSPREVALALRQAEPEHARLVLAQLETMELEALARTWQLQAHDYQLRPGQACSSNPTAAPIWYLNGGRGSGKSRAIAERRLDRGEDYGPKLRGILAGKTIADARDVMIEGESGMLACAEKRGYRLEYIANRRTVRHPSGASWLVLTSEKPDLARGPQSNDLWGDEVSSWKEGGIKFFDNLMMGHRLKLGVPLEADFSSTPKPNPITRRLLKDPKWRKRVAVTLGISHRNFANLDDGFRDLLVSIYDGTTLGKQELYGELLDALGACVAQEIIDRHRLAEPYDIVRKVVSLDPAATSKTESDDSGIVVVGADSQEYPHAYVLADLTLSSAPPERVAEAVVDAYDAYGCDAIVYESNNGGEWIESAIKAAADAKRIRGIEIVSVWARKSKKARFEPVGALYEKGRVHHIGTELTLDPHDGVARGFVELEKEATSWIPGEPSPNRLDALSQGVSHLLLGDDLVGPLAGYL